MKFTHVLAANCNFTIVFNFDASHATYINNVGETGETSDTGDFGHYTQPRAEALNHESIVIYVYKHQIRCIQTFEYAERTGVNFIRLCIFLRQKLVFLCSLQFRFHVCKTLLYTLIQKKKHIHTTITLHTHYKHSKYNIDYI